MRNRNKNYLTENGSALRVKPRRSFSSRKKEAGEEGEKAIGHNKYIVLLFFDCNHHEITEMTQFGWFQAKDESVLAFKVGVWKYATKGGSDRYVTIYVLKLYFQLNSCVRVFVPEHGPVCLHYGWAIVAGYLISLRHECYNSWTDFCHHGQTSVADPFWS